MHRLFGRAKEAPPPPSLAETSDNMTARVDKIDDQIKKLDAQLAVFRDQIRKARPGPAQESLKRRALAVLKQKKMYEQQIGNMMNQQFNVEQTRFHVENMQTNITVVQSMKAANKEMKTAIKKTKELNLNYIDNLMDDMNDMAEHSNEINEMLSYSYGVPDGLDEASLMEELEGLEDDLMYAEGPSKGGVPSYLQEPELPDELPQAPAHAVVRPQPAAAQEEELAPMAART